MRICIPTAYLTRQALVVIIIKWRLDWYFQTLSFNNNQIDLEVQMKLNYFTVEICPSLQVLSLINGMKVKVEVICVSRYTAHGLALSIIFK